VKCTIIGTVKSPITDPLDVKWGKVLSEIILKDEYTSGLLGLEGFSHLIVLTFLHKAKFIPRNISDAIPRTRHRPNRIGVTAVEIIEIRDNRIKVRALDAIDGTPIIDIKPYVPVYDRKDATIPEWMETMMKDYF
jgi:tRNA-Thr(GGU) m(6)t(6)A37 methyltransferase TsaA